MTDIRTMLHQAAPLPATPVDVAALRARAKRRSLRRRVGLLLGLGLVAGIGVPVGSSVLTPAHEGERVGTIGEKHLQDHIADRDPTERRVGANEPAERPSSNTPAATSRPTVAAPSRVAVTEYPLANACSVDDAGLAPGAQRRCRFTATRGGGASFRNDGPTSPPPGVSPTGEVRVTRDGQTTSHNIESQQVAAGELGAFACGAFIEPGDLVEVILTNSNTDGSSDATVTLGAGENWECWNTG